MRKGIIVVSFGTSYAETRKLSIESIEELVRKNFPDDLVVRAFTSEIVRNKLSKRDNLLVDNLVMALERIKAEGIRDVYIQSLHIIRGHEYEKMLNQARDFLEENKDFKITIGQPLLSSEESYSDTVDALDLVEDRQGEGLVYMGHGSDHEADMSYDKLEESIRKKAFNNVFIGTVEGSRTIEKIIEELKEKEIKKVVLKPLMLVAGDHAINDMASDEEDSWKTMIESHDIRVEVELKGLGENTSIQNIFLESLKEIYK